MEYKFGLIPSPYDARDYEFKTLVPLGAIQIPSSYESKRPPIFNQGDTMMCAACAYASLRYIQELDQSGNTEKFSPLFQYANRIDGENFEGMYLRSVCSKGREGSVLYRELPGFYDLATCQSKVNIDKSRYMELANPFRIQTYYVCKSRQEIQAAIMNTGGVIIGIPVYDSFMYVGGDGIVKYNPNRDIHNYGGHAQLLIGWKYIGSTLYWISVNSWGETWGDGGVCYLPESYPWCDNGYAVLDAIRETTIKEYYAKYYDDNPMGSSYADSVAFAKAKKLFWGGLNSYTPSGKSLFVQAGKFGKVPHVGDRVYFYTASLGRVQHVGLVIEVKKSGSTYTIKTAEGNTSSTAEFERNGGVFAIKTYTFNENNVGGTNRINGFGTPNFGPDTCTAEELIAVELAEIGYIEKATNAKLGDIERNSTDSEKKANPGSNNFTKFGKFYGIVDGQWCEMSQAWCGYIACKNHSSKNGWVKEGTNWYYFQNGAKVKDKWLLLNGRWYVFVGDGRAVQNNWFQSNGSWYYLGSDCAMLENQWFKYKDKWYYLAPSSGNMVTNSYVRDKNGYCYCDKDGVWDGKYVKSVPSGYDIV